MRHHNVQYVFARVTAMKNLTRFFNPALRDALIAACAVMLIAVITGIAVYMSAGAALKKEVQAGLLNTAKSAAGLLDMDLHKQLNAPEQKGGELYEQARAPLFKLLEANHNIAFIYTVVRGEDKKIHFILDSAIPKPGKEDETSGVMEEYTDASEIMLQAFDERRSMVEDQPYSDEWGTFLSAYAPIKDASGTFVGMVGADIRLDDYLAQVAEIRQALLLGIAVAFIASLLAGAAVWYVRKTALHAQEQNRLQQEQMHAMEDRQRTERAEQERLRVEQQKRDMHEVAESFEATVSHVIDDAAHAAADIQASIAGVITIATDTYGRSQQVVQSVDEATLVASQVSAAAEELTASIREISVQTQKSNSVAVSANQKAQSARTLISSLSEKSSHVGDVLSFITDIAEQINLLALNATIEAARAGEAGKGFAVVASEVKNMATRVGGATKDIAAQITEMQKATDTSSAAVIAIIDTIAELSHSIDSVAAAVEEQSAVTQEISQSIVHVVENTRRISSNIDAVQTGSQKTGGTADEVLERAKALNEQFGVLKQQVDGFLARIAG